MNGTLDIETLVKWGKSREVQTKFGARLLRKAKPTQAFWDAWQNGQKENLKAAGVSMGQDRMSGEWEVMHWQQLDQAVTARREENLTLSRAADADVQIPVPEGLAYMPFQKAGILWACRQFGLDLLTNTPLPKGCPSISGGAFIADEMGL